MENVNAVPSVICVTSAYLVQLLPCETLQWWTDITAPWHSECSGIQIDLLLCERLKSAHLHQTCMRSVIWGFISCWFYIHIKWQVNIKTWNCMSSWTRQERTRKFVSIFLLKASGSTYKWYLFIYLFIFHFISFYFSFVVNKHAFNNICFC